MSIRQSCFQAGLKCRRAFKHAQTHKSEPSKAMIDGLVFEGFVFGFKDDATQYAFNKDGSTKKTGGVQNIQRIAELIKPLFGEGNAHERDLPPHAMGKRGRRPLHMSAGPLTSNRTESMVRPPSSTSVRVWNPTCGVHGRSSEPSMTA